MTEPHVENENLRRNMALRVEEIAKLTDTVTHQCAERQHLRELAAKVRDYWRNNPGHTKDGISTPGMVLLMAVEGP